jgi:hypothetical protein
MTTRFYIFLDVSTNCDIHYPQYNGGDANLDTTGGRVNVSSNVMDQPAEILSLLQQQQQQEQEQQQQHPIWQSKFMTQLRTTGHLHLVKILYFDCHSVRIDPTLVERRQNSNLPIVFAAYHPPALMVGAGDNNNNNNPSRIVDVALPPPLRNKAVDLTPIEIESIYHNCTADWWNATHYRPYYITYIVRDRPSTTGHPNNADQFRARKVFADLNDNRRIFGLRYYTPEFQQSSIGNVTYENILKRSVYAGAPQGDLHYLYRFMEVLASGSIPIVLADDDDDWILPFHPDFIHWEECIIRLPTKISGLELLKHIAPISVSERCIRRKKCYTIYRNYMETGRKVIDGIIQGLEQMTSELS